MKRAFLLFYFVILSSFTSCISSPVLGIIYTDTTHHIHDRSTSNLISSAKVEKRGESCSFSSIVFSIAFYYYGAGGSIQEAMEKGGITKPAVIDRSSFSFLGPVAYMDCVVVWGE